MNRTVSIVISLLFIIALGGFLFFFTPNDPVAPAEETATTTPIAPEEPQAPREDTSAVNAYVSENISLLSTEPEVLGGTFFVTDITSSDGTGVVSYEDGHNAYTADFAYSVDAAGLVMIDSFVVRPL